MSAPKLRRWKCPRCEKGVNAPGRMRRDDVRRFCLPCSSTTGRLVEREAPALEAARAKRSETAAEKRKREAQRARERGARERDRRKALDARATERAREADRVKHDLGGEDLRVIAARMWALAPMVERHGGRRLPEIGVHRSEWGSSSGRAWGWRLHVTLTRGSPISGTEILLHELVHCAVGTGHGHDAFFWSTLRATARAYWPDVDFRYHEGPTRGYAIDSWIVSRVHEHEQAVAS